MQSSCNTINNRYTIHVIININKLDFLMKIKKVSLSKKTYLFVMKIFIYYEFSLLSGINLFQVFFKKIGDKTENYFYADRKKFNTKTRKWLKSWKLLLQANRDSE